MMKRLCIYIIGVTCLVLASCDLHSSDNGDLDGFWQLTAVDTLATGGTTDMRHQQLTWCVQGSLLTVYYNYASEAPWQTIFRFRHEGDQLTLSEPYVSSRDDGDIRIEDPRQLNELGICHLEETFKVLQLDSDRMLLQSDRLRLSFRKY